VPHPKVKIADNSGNEVGVTSNALDVNIAGGSSIDIGDVDIHLSGNVPLLGNTGTVAAGVLRVSIATDDNVSTKLTSIDGDTSNISNKANTISTNIASLVSFIQTEDAAHSNADVGYMQLGVRNDTLASLVSDDGDYAPLQVNASGALYVTSGADHNDPVVANGMQIMAETKTVDGSALPNATAEGDAIRVAATRGGVLYACLTDGTGQIAHPNATDDSSQDSTPGMLNVGGEYRSSDTTYTSGDATILQTNVNGLLRVDGSDVTQPVSGTVTANLGTTDNAVLDAIASSLEILDDWDDSNYANVNINLAGSDAPTGGGVESGALRVTLANDSTGVITVDGTVDLGSTATTHLSEIEGAVETIEGAVSGSEMQVDVVAALPAGTNGIGKLTANSGVDIGDVDVTSIIPGTSATNLGKAIQASQGSTDTGVPPLAVRNDVLADLSGDDHAYTPLQVSGNGALYVTHGILSMFSEVNNDVGTSPEDLRVAGDISCRRVDMMASPSNAGYIWVGDSSVANDGTGGGIRLAPGDFYSVDVNAVNDLHVAATVSGEDIMYTYYT